MTIDRAIEILDPDHREHYESLEPVNEACRMGIKALKWMQTAYVGGEWPMWVSVEDELPEDVNDVLIVANLELKSGGYIESAIIIGYLNPYDGTFHFDDSQNYAKVEVTHWMPLPLLP